MRASADALVDRWKRSGEQYDDRVVEVVWSKDLDSFQFMRFRDDKFEGNYKDVVNSIIRSIQDGVEAEGVSPFLTFSFRIGSNGQMGS